MRSPGHAPATAELAAVTAGVAAPARRERTERWSEQMAVLAPALAVAGVLVLVWLIAYPHTPDLAAQVYRVGLFRQLGFAVWDGNWYAGHHLPGYSLLFPALGTAIGLRAAGALCVLASTALFASLVAGEYGRAARWGAAAFAVAAVGDVWLGRLAFALGVAIALGAALALRRGHPLAAGVLAVLAAAASPVAGLLLGLAAATVAIVQRSPRALLALAVPAAAVVLPLAMLFPEGGYEPFPFLSFAVTVAVIAAFAAALPAEERLLRAGAGVYLAACVLCLLVHSPVGSNIERYGVLLGAPLLLCALLRDRPGEGRAGIGLAGALALAAIGTWVLWGPVRETSSGGRNPCHRQRVLPAARALPRRARRGSDPDRGAAHALALGGGDARPARGAGTRLGEAARQPLRRRAARERRRRARLPRMAGPRGGLIRRAARRPARSVQCRRGPSDPLGDCRT